MTKERPILFSDEMVRVILAGRKTQTRRVVKPQPVGLIAPIESYGPKGLEIAFGPDNLRPDGGPRWWRSPYGMARDRLWVREAFRDARTAMAGRVLYRASGDTCCGWKPGIHMPRALSRIMLEVVDVRVERLQAISPADCVSEGYSGNPAAHWETEEGAALDWYRRLWDSINAKRGHTWESNPWVWVVEFRRIEAEAAL